MAGPRGKSGNPKRQKNTICKPAREVFVKNSVLRRVCVRKRDFDPPELGVLSGPNWPRVRI